MPEVRKQKVWLRMGALGLQKEPGAGCVYHLPGLQAPDTDAQKCGNGTGRVGQRIQGGIVMNPCECGGEVYIRYEMEPIFGTHYTAVCEECGAVYPLMANNRIDAEKEWNEIVSNFGGE